jgi:hypothetical protein
LSLRQLLLDGELPDLFAQKFKKKSWDDAHARYTTFQASISVLDILSYGGEGQFDPWATPVVSLDNNHSCLISGVLCFGNRAFVLESILRNQDYAMDIRGPAFERHLHSELTSALEQCQFRSLVKLSKPSLVVATEEGKEEIDLFLCIGRDVYVIEAKCALFPVEPRSEYFFRKKMHEADEQLERKIEFARRNWRKVQSENIELGRFPADPSQIAGIIVTNFHGGPLPGLKHPISEPSALVHYFVAGRTILGAAVSAK